MPLERLKARLKGTGKTLVLPEGDDQRVIDAARQLEAQGLAKVALVTSGGGVPDAPNLAIEDPATSPFLQEFAELYRLHRPKTGTKVAARLVKKTAVFRRHDGAKR